jgi:hypothetical protein
MRLINVLATEAIPDEPNQSAEGIRHHISDVCHPNSQDVLDGLSRKAGAEHNEQLAPEVQPLEVDAQQYPDRDKDEGVLDGLA